MFVNSIFSYNTAKKQKSFALEQSVDNSIKKDNEHLKANGQQIPTDLSEYPNLAYLLHEFDFPAQAESKSYTPSQIRFFETVNSNKALRNADFEDFLENKAQISPESYFIRMKHYKQDMPWAQDMVNLTYFISDLIEKGVDIKNIIKNTAFGIYYINDKHEYGVLKSYAIWGVHSKGYSIENNKRGEEYLEKYKTKIKKNYNPKPTEEYDIITNTISIYPNKKGDSFLILYPDCDMYDYSNLDIVKQIYNELKNNENPSKKEIVSAMAKIQWLIAQETPYIRGSDSVATILTRSIAHAYHIPVSPLKEGISLDFEAWFQDMDKYIKNYPKYFEKNPLE